MEITRRKTISSLFNTMDTTFNAPLANSFIDFVDDSLNPHFLDFYDNNWYAEVNCVFKSAKCHRYGTTDTFEPT
ncbi:MAG: hypothetical protein R2764_15135 [Bacteroidales bacterium]